MKTANYLNYTLEKPYERFSCLALALKSLDPTSISNIC